MKKVDKLRQEYEEIQTPQDLDSFMDTCIDQAQKKQSRFTFYRLWKPALSAALIGYLIVLNTVPAFAQSVFAIPLLNRLRSASIKPPSSCIRTVHRFGK